MFIFDPMYLIVVLLPTLILTGIATWRVKSNFAKYSKVPIASGLTGAQAAYKMLADAGLADSVGIERHQGFLSDHYDPRHKVLRLSPHVYDERSIAAVGVACHEAGHAIQDARRYAPLVLRNAIVPTANIGSNLGYILIIIGLMLNAAAGAGLGFNIAVIGLLLFATVVVFQFVNLPVEFNASTRAKEQLAHLGIIGGVAEARGVNAVLNAAAMTYVAATFTALLNLLYYAWIIFGGRRN